MTEAALQQMVIDLARRAGYLHYHTVDSRKSRPGFPDLILVHVQSGHLIIAELKAEKGRMSDAQQQWLTLLGKRHEVHLWRPADWESGEIRRALFEGRRRAAA